MNDRNFNKPTAAGSPAARTPCPGDGELASLAKAIAHPARIQILRILAGYRTCVCGDIVSELPLAQSTVSEHLRILKSAGLISGEVDGPRVCYCINNDNLGRFKTLVLGLPCPDAPVSPSKCQEE